MVSRRNAATNGRTGSCGEPPPDPRTGIGNDGRPRPRHPALTTADHLRIEWGHPTLAVGPGWNRPRTGYRSRFVGSPAGESFPLPGGRPRTGPGYQHLRSPWCRPHFHQLTLPACRHLIYSTSAERPACATYVDWTLGRVAMELLRRSLLPPLLPPEAFVPHAPRISARGSRLCSLGNVCDFSFLTW